MGVLAVNMVFLIANLNKIPYGGYISLLIAFIPFSIIFIFVKGQKKLAAALKPVPLDEFLGQYNETV